ncbi:RsiV family protein [Desulfosporosinus meridiei]|uniref:DUF3298 domain-containing protein n=1 Tax=Desulfosporosinus meridiei (strain ATCC BAA-275 / DSM 13257 / KCTC 12902 / NCIMB 13706 / S10) TaxID=768704 RepID=J7IVR1_DESMD|nr:RsiV family protein [Desulfosporosinus meridiei]AFQ45805.1 Protein of unknown function (DUF3298) [Desulfosporosinus meridiei DSM 13257]
MERRNLQHLKKEYLETPIPGELDYLVSKALKDKGESKMKRKITVKKISVVVASIAACVALLMVGINSSQVFASTLSKVPVIGSIVKVLTFREYTVNGDKFNVDIKVPSIQGLENKALENSLNEKYVNENKKLYEEFKAEMEDIQKKGGGNLGVNSGYMVKTDTDRILSIGRYTVITKASGVEKLKYDTIDKENEVLITLPSLFKDNSYVEVISENIKAQMREQMKADEGKIYWVDDKETYIEVFDKISASQNFFINTEGKLVISFDEYEVGPGYMGIQEFIIPTEVISDILISNEYIR